MKINLADKQALIPRRPDGYPNFQVSDVSLEDWAHQLLQVFTKEEIVELCNRCIYQLEYQQFSHAKRQQAQREFEQPIKLAFKQLYPHESWSKATFAQLEAAIKLAEQQK